MAVRQYDVVVYGATGFTGQRVAQEISNHPISKSLKFAIAGRDIDKLNTIRNSITGNIIPSVLVADVYDDKALSKVIAYRHTMSERKACEWVVEVSIKKRALIYNLYGRPVAYAFNMGTDLLAELLNYDWQTYSENDSVAISQNGESITGIAITKTDAKKFFFPGDAFEETPKGTHSLWIDPQEDISETQKKAEQQNPISKDLAKLNEASSLFWLNADPSDRDTHPTNDNVSDWLKSQGFSEISAKQGASIIRPEWAAKGRR